MKHPLDALTNFFLSVVEYSESNVIKPKKINNFHHGALLSLVNFFDAVTLIISPPELFKTVEDHMRPNWDSNHGLALPGISLIASTPDGFVSENEQQRQISKSIIQSFYKDIRFILTTNEALNEKIFFQVDCYPIELNKDTRFDTLIEWLIQAGYINDDIVTLPGTYTIRGGIVDVFPLSSNIPVRVNFLGDDSDVFSFNVDSQMTTGNLSSIKISPVANVGENGMSFLEFYNIPHISVKLEIDGTLIICDETDPMSEMDFPFSPISLQSFLTLQTDCVKQVEINDHLTLVGLTDNKNIIIPPWFTERVFPDNKEYRKNYSHIVDFNKIEPGDILTHNDYGLCRYLGLRKSEDNDNEFILLEFADHGLISLSVQMIRKLCFYASSNQPGVLLDSLTKSSSWHRKKASAEKEAEEIVDNLLMSYAKRTSAVRKPFQRDVELERVFISRFQFQDTDDQVTVWNEISRDLSSRDIPMNRLLCGDVGFGKTELAVRTSFRVVYNGKQVAILAPTTILVNQLFTTFKSRLSEFGVRVDMVSRFRSKKEITKTLDRLYSGELDIIIGTHSLLSDNVKFSNLGLLIIDEEQRFGVNQKEKILQLQKNIDLLSMSATPIPRTLHLAISGIREISTLQTPPVSRHPIRTQVLYFNIETIKRSIMNEIRRSGQVYFVHNEVKSIYEIFELLSKHLPMLNISVAHGQEATSILEKTIIDFQNKKIDVLVCSSIIETGIDIPNTNTIIINRAHRFGLAQLHQIRGRVGRSHQKASALLLIPRGLSLNENAYRRLKAIEKHSGLGEGYNISSMDLEIRGSGTVFGYRQSGGVGRVGAELYTQLINQALKSKINPNVRNKMSVDQVVIAVYNDGTIPETYIKPESIRLDFYRKLAQVNTAEAMLEVEYALENRFGPIPPLLHHLIFETKTRIRCCQLGIETVRLTSGILSFEFIREWIISHLEDIFIVSNNFFSSYKLNYWYKEQPSGRFKIFVSGFNPEDITSTIDTFFDKLHDAYYKK